MHINLSDIRLYMYLRNLLQIITIQIVFCLFLFTWYGTFLILNSRSLVSRGGPCLNVRSPKSLYTTRNPKIFAVSESH